MPKITPKQAYSHGYQDGLRMGEQCLHAEDKDNDIAYAYALGYTDGYEDAVMGFIGGAYING